MRDALHDVRTLLEDSPAPLSVPQMVERLEGEHERAAVEHLLEHFRHEGLAQRTGDGQWGWAAETRPGHAPTLHAAHEVHGST